MEGFVDMDKQLLPCHCNDCKCWAIFEVEHAQGGLAMFCTHCKTKSLKSGTKQEILKFISITHRIMKEFSTTNPKMATLKNPGDFVEP